MSRSYSVHPFPAKMAPELVSAHISTLDEGAVVLDPMMGSGTFLLEAAAHDLYAIGLDSDPMAMLITQAAAWVGDENALLDEARRIARRVHSQPVSALLPDAETAAFVDFWFDVAAQQSLAALAAGIMESTPAFRPVLWCAFSRLIITKDSGASRARDVSHSRPHVVRETSSFDPRLKFESSVETVLKRRTPLTTQQRGRLSLATADARQMPVSSNSVDAIMTSPPYLTAIDYLRGHRMSLVWMGHSLSELRGIRGGNIGTERGAASTDQLDEVRALTTDGDLTPRKVKILNRYLLDLGLLLGEMARVVRPEGTITFVVANSNHGGTQVRVDDALAFLGQRYGLDEVAREVRLLPAGRRYLPPPSGAASALNGRMGQETILTLRR